MTDWEYYLPTVNHTRPVMQLTFKTAYDLLAELVNPSRDTLTLLAQAALVSEKEIEQDMFADQQHDEDPATIDMLKARAINNVRERLGELIDSVAKEIGDISVDMQAKVKRSVAISYDFRDGGPLR